MIDFITLSRDDSKIRTLTNSIAAWLQGSSHEWTLIRLDGARYDIFSGYNAGASQGQGEILAFVHDDVRFLGNRLTLEKPLELFRAADTGFLGIAGTRLLLEHACWWASNPQTEGRGMVCHPAEGEFGIQWDIWPMQQVGLFGRVAVLDGVFLMCQRETFNRLGGFDAQTYRGFHFYDVDITFRALQLGLVNYAVPIPVFHNHIGMPSHEWQENQQIFLRKFGKFLRYSI